LVNASEAFRNNAKSVSKSCGQRTFLDDDDDDDDEEPEKIFFRKSKGFIGYVAELVAEVEREVDREEFLL
jgi:hypothetical protein